MSGGKRMAEPEGFDWSQIPFKKIAIIAIVVAVILLIITISVHIINKKSEETNGKTDTVSEENNEKMTQKYEGYDVLGELVVEKINLDKYIVDSKEDDAMAKTPVKLYGDKLNDIGNFCIAGHNYDEVFAKLSELKVGDKFYIIDREDIIQDYEIKEILEVEPTKLDVLMPVDDKIQVTLITCIDGASKRLVIVAERINIEG